MKENDNLPSNKELDQWLKEYSDEFVEKIKNNRNGLTEVGVTDKPEQLIKLEPPKRPSSLAVKLYDFCLPGAYSGFGIAFLGCMLATVGIALDNQGVFDVSRYFITGGMIVAPISAATFCLIGAAKRDSTKSK
ncbi:MAG: hypothetical protein PHQ59_00395 [Candidatus Daviesbacteria bacterium]|nr:hypothetical protein [Candidatus Daviesbacteria bacterium]